MDIPLAPFPWLDLAIILALIALNGVFAMSELAIVSARRQRLEALAARGERGAQTALMLGADPGRFLSTVQIGITLIGIIAGAFSGASLGHPTAVRLTYLGFTPELAETLGFVIVIGMTTYASLVIGELVPKQFALRAPEPLACIMSVPMLWLSHLTAPLVWLLDKSSAMIFLLLRLERESENKVTAEELHLVVAEASKSGVIEESERAIISGVVRLADRPAREVMTPRTEVDWLPIDATAAQLIEAIGNIPHSRIPVADGSVDNIIGIVQSRDLLLASLTGKEIDLRQMLRKTLVIPDQIDAMDALDALRQAEVPMLLVHDEYGHFEGLITPADLLIAIAGSFASDADLGLDPAISVLEDGQLLISGSMAADAMADRLGFELPEDRDYATAAGFVLDILRHLPKTGEHFEHQGWRMTIADMDGRRIDKLLVRPTHAKQHDTAAATTTN